LILIPAIDVKKGRCVRLKQGVMSEETVYSDSPAEVALRWYSEGAERLHLVDLDGAIHGKPISRDVVKEIVDSVPIPVELGGGIRDVDTIEGYLSLGIRWVILGTAAYRNPELVSTACREFPGRIIVGIDARDGQVAVEGWTEDTDLSVVELAKRYEEKGVSAVIYTDIHRDGMSMGPNVEGTGRLAEKISVPVIASGGISGIKDIEKILELSKYGVIGMITGRALYEGKLSLREALECVKKKRS